MKMLVAETEKLLAGAIEEWFLAEKFEVENVVDGAIALKRMIAGTFDIVILDCRLPAISALDVCRQYRNSGGTSPVVCLLNTDSESSERVIASGVDNYLEKPFPLEELSSVVRALLRRKLIDKFHGSVTVGDLVVDLDSRAVHRNGREVHLQPIEFRLLAYFCSRSEEVLSAEALWKDVWNQDGPAPDTVRTHIKTLRQKIHSDSKPYIQTVHKRGYKLVAPELRYGSLKAASGF